MNPDFIVDLFQLLAVVGVVCGFLCIAGAIEWIATNWSKRK